MTPSQSLSRPSQISGAGPIAPSHANEQVEPWLRQRLCPLRQVEGGDVLLIGLPFMSSGGQGSPSPTGLSSTMPLQSLSRQSQISGVGWVPPVQIEVPF